LVEIPEGKDNSPRLRLGCRIIDENILFTLKESKGIQSIFISRVKRPIEMLCPKYLLYTTR
jgi:hypothetical protein